MEAERWKRIDDLLQSALQIPAERREEFLRQACGGDMELVREVRTLITSHGKAAGFLDRPAIEVAAKAVALSEAPAAAGDSILGRTMAHYRVLRKLGSGGMGVVYEAEDLRLGRHVALKLLLDSQAANSKARLRFEQEARAISSLNHPHICTLYEVEEYEGRPVIVMELLEGQTLKERMRSGRIPLAELLQCGIDIADALDAAHATGLIHRDIKPANIFITSRGRVKVLDFGLAKLTTTLPGFAQSEEEPLTSLGVIPGTTPYMSPEQVRGDELDGRTDVFSVGAVLYEMASGQRAFGEKNLTLIMDAVLHNRPPALRQINPEMPPKLEQIIEKALEKDLEHRYQSAVDLETDLKGLQHDTESGRVTAGSARAQALDEVRSSGARDLWKFVAPALLLAALIAGGLYYRSHQIKPLTAKDTIVLADFTNSTGDVVFDDALKQGLSVQLEQSPFLLLTSDRKVNETLKLMGRSAGDRLTPEVTREVCLRTGSKAMLTGSIASLGSQYVIGLRAVNCETGDVLAEAQDQARDMEGVLKALDACAVSVRSKLGESLTSVQKYATPLREATTPSLEALRVYSLGMKTSSVEGAAAVIPFLKRTVEIDPAFAEAYASLSSAYAQLNEQGRAAEYGRKAYELRQNVSEVERFAIETNYYEVTTGEPGKAAQMCELWRKAYPRDARPVRDLGYMYATLGNHQKALEKAREALELGPRTAGYYDLLGREYANLGRLDEAEAVYREAERRNLENEALLLARYELAFVKGDAGLMEQQTAAAMSKPGKEHLLLAAQANTQAWFGKLRSARELTQRAVDSADHGDAKETAAIYHAEAALREVEVGNRDWALAAVKAATRLALNPDVRCMGALVLARASDAAEAEKLAAEIHKMFPENTLVENYWLPSIRAAVAMRHKDPRRAIELLKLASETEMSTDALTGVQMSLVPVYLRGEAYLMLHDGNRAAAEFQQFIDHAGLVGNFPWGALARLGLARAYAMQGDSGKARGAYQKFLTLWKDADPDLPVLRQAKSEYKNLT